MGTDRRRSRQHGGVPLWRVLILLALTKNPGATPPGAFGSEQQPETKPCPWCDSKLRLKSGRWVCRRNEEHYLTQEQLEQRGLG